MAMTSGSWREQGAQAALESQARRQVDLGLGHARDGGLDGVFQRGQAGSPRDRAANSRRQA